MLLENLIWLFCFITSPIFKTQLSSPKSMTGMWKLIINYSETMHCLFYQMQTGQLLLLMVQYCLFPKILFLLFTEENVAFHRPLKTQYHFSSYNCLYILFCTESKRNNLLNSEVMNSCMQLCNKWWFTLLYYLVQKVWG